MATTTLSPLAEKVSHALFIGGDDGAAAAVLEIPEEVGFDRDSTRDQQIQEWGLCVGLAFAISFQENPFAGAEPAIEAAHKAACEVFFQENPELKAVPA